MRGLSIPALALLVGGLASAGPAAPSAAEILERAERVRNPDLDFAVEFTIDVTDPTSLWKERHQSYSMIAQGKDRSLVLMREPESFHPGTLLIRDGAYWLLLPRTSKPLQLSPRHVLAGDIANGDLARGNLLAFYQPRLLGDVPVGDRPCYRLELLRTDPLGLYPRIVASFEKKTFRPLVFEYFGQTGDQLKTARYEDYGKGPLGVRATRIEVETPGRPTEHTTLRFSNLRALDASRLDFSREAMIAFRDAANDLAVELGRQARIEEILARLTSRGAA